jgi:putative NADH-flavin reductase
VSVLARNPTKLPPGKYNLTIQLGDVLDADAVDDTVFGQEVVVSALGLGDNQVQTALSSGIANIARAMQVHGVKRFVGVAGAGILLDANRGGLRIDAPDYPAAFRPYGEEHRRIYDLLRQSALDWTLVCPPAMRDEAPTGTARTEVDQMPPGGRTVTYGDVARLVYKLATTREYVGQRVAIAD